jgi:hypothetical protein
MSAVSRPLLRWVEGTKAEEVEVEAVVVVVVVVLAVVVVAAAAVVACREALQSPLHPSRLGLTRPPPLPQLPLRQLPLQVRLLLLCFLGPRRQQRLKSLYRDQYLYHLYLHLQQMMETVAVGRKRSLSSHSYNNNNIL